MIFCRFNGIKREEGVIFWNIFFTGKNEFYVCGKCGIFETSTTMCPCCALRDIDQYKMS